MEYPPDITDSEKHPIDKSMEVNEDTSSLVLAWTKVIRWLPNDYSCRDLRVPHAHLLWGAKVIVGNDGISVYLY